MLDRLAFYRDLIVSECLPAVPGAPPGFADYLFAGVTAALGLFAMVMLVQGFRGRDDARSQRIKAAVLEDCRAAMREAHGRPPPALPFQGEGARGDIHAHPRLCR